jgi:hypothetical protein
MILIASSFSKLPGSNVTVARIALDSAGKGFGGVVG